MKAEDLLKAMNHLDSNIIMEAKEPPARRRSPRRLITVLVAVMIVMSLAVSAAASELGGGWFRQFFEDKADLTLTDSQIFYLNENAKTFAQQPTQDSPKQPTRNSSQPAQNSPQRQTQNGYTMELKSALTDGQMAYITIGITAPEDVVLNATTIEGYNPAKPSLRPGNSSEPNFLTDENGLPLYGYSSWESREDYDGLANTQDLVIAAEPDFKSGQDSFSANMVWNIHFEDLIATYFNIAYQEELPDNYISFDAEEAAKLYPQVTLAKGTWDFTVDFSSSDTREIELIRSPIRVSTSVSGNGENGDADMEVTSFVLRSLSATICSDGPGFSLFLDIYAVMKDGSQIKLMGKSGSTTEESFWASSPIPLDEVDHILLPDGTKLPMPQL